MPEELDALTYRQAIDTLIVRDQDLARVVARWGPPPFWVHSPGFPGLTFAILAQQVSLESARAAFHKLQASLDVLSPQAFLTLHGDRLREIGFSRQKAAYVRQIAQDLATGQLDLEALARLADAQARNRLMQLRGVGKWTADTYLLFSLRRPDVWPSQDLALEKAVSELRGMSEKLDTATVDRIALGWRPLRAVAARILWFAYLNRRNRIQTTMSNLD